MVPWKKEDIILCAAATLTSPLWIPLMPFLYAIDYFEKKLEEHKMKQKEWIYERLMEIGRSKINNDNCNNGNRDRVGEREYEIYRKYYIERYCQEISIELRNILDLPNSKEIISYVISHGWKPLIIDHYILLDFSDLDVLKEFIGVGKIDNTCMNLYFNNTVDDADAIAKYLNNSHLVMGLLLSKLRSENESFLEFEKQNLLPIDEGYFEAVNNYILQIPNFRQECINAEFYYRLIFVCNSFDDSSMHSFLYSLCPYYHKDNSEYKRLMKINNNGLIQTMLLTKKPILPVELVRTLCAYL